MNRAPPAPLSPVAAPVSPEPWLTLALQEERRLSQIFGGYTVELPGAHLVVNEKVPVPRFNWVQDVRCGPGRVTALLERVFDHYYQRALRPIVELPSDLPQPWLVKALGMAGYLPKGPEHRRHLMVWDGFPRPEEAPRTPSLRIEPVPAEEIDLFVDFLIEPKHRTEVYRSLETVMVHPNAGEIALPYVARVAEDPVAFGLFHRYGAASALFAVGTVAKERRKGFATSLVAEIVRREGPRSPSPLLISMEGERPPRPLVTMGFVPWASFDRYELSDEAGKKGF